MSTNERTLTGARSARRLAALTVAAACLLAGCGGDDGSSEQEFARKADAICTDVETRVTELNKANPQSASELNRFIDQLKRAVESGINRLQALDRPEGDAGRTAQQFTDTLDRQYDDQVLPALDELQTAVIERDKKGLKAASKKLASIKDTESNRLATRLGAKTCAQ